MGNISAQQLDGMLKWVKRIPTFLRDGSGNAVFVNAVSNYFAAAWTSALSFIAIPILLRMLGPDQWGIVALCATAQGALNMLDAGMSLITPKYFAASKNDGCRTAELYSVFLVLYCLIALVGFLIIQAVAPIVASSLQKSAIEAPQIEAALRILGIQFLFQFANNVNLGLWLGSGRQKLGNIRTSIFSTLRYAIGFLMLCWIGPSARVYLLTVSAICCIEFILNTLWNRRKLETVSVSIPRWALEARRIVSEMGGFTIAVLIGLAVSQMDRMYLSSVLPLSVFGSYAIAANLALAFMQLQHPLLKAFFPGIVAGSRGSGSLLLAAVFFICVIPCGIAAVFAPEIFGFWLKDASVAESAILPFRLIVLAVGINSVYHVIYQKIIAAVQGKAAILINITSLLCGGLVVGIGSNAPAAYLGGLIWLSTSISQLLMGAIWIAKYEPRSSHAA